MKAAQIKQLAVVSITTGERLGTVSEIILDNDARRMAALVVSSGGGGLFSSESATVTRIAAKDVHSIGPDAVTVQTPDMLHEVDSDTTGLPVSAIMGEKVVTEGGTYVGQVASVEISPDTRQVSGLEVSAGFFSGNRVVPVADFVTIGDELIIVSDTVVQQQEPEQSGSAESSEDGRSSRIIVNTVDGVGDGTTSGSERGR